MPHEGEIDWIGQSDTKYHYWIYPIDTTFDAVLGNYIFAKEIRSQEFIPIYIGETGDLSERFDDHHAMPCIRRNGATHIHVHKSSEDQEVRRAEESDLIAKWNPVCNA